LSAVLVHEAAHGNITSVGLHIHTLAAPEADAALQRDAFHDDPFGDLLAADAASAPPAIPPAKPPTPPSKPPPPRPPMASVVTAETHTGAFALQTSAAAEGFEGDPFLALAAQPSAATSAASHELPAAPAGTAGFGDLDDFGAASHGTASQQQPQPQQQQQQQQQDAFGLPAQTGSSQDLFAGSLEDPFAALQPEGAGESAHAGALQEARGGEDDFTDSSRESEGGHREDAPRAPAAQLPGLDKTGGMDMTAGAQGELAEVAPNVSTPPPPPDPARVAAPPPPRSPPPRSPPPPPPQVQTRGVEVMDSFVALAAPFGESPRRQEGAGGAMEGGMGVFVGGGMGGPGGESLHSSNSTADSLWDALADSGSTALPSHDTHSLSPAAAAASHPADTFSPPTAVPPTTPPLAPTGDPPLSPQQPMKAAAAPPGGASPPQAHAKGPLPPPAKLDAGG
jgi:hypothetical protein